MRELTRGVPVRCRIPQYWKFTGTLSAFEASAEGTPGAWVDWDLPAAQKATTGCYFLLRDLVLDEREKRDDET